MRYEKPIVMDLSTRARFANGQGPLSCMDGSSPVHEGVCGTGTDPSFIATCTAGPTAGDCAGGSSAGATCLSGSTTTLNYECAAGTGGAAGSCTVGPSFLP